MKLTKVLRDKVEKELTAKRNEVNKQARADYDKRKKQAQAEIEEIISNILPDIKEVLEDYGMDTDNIYDTTYYGIIKFNARLIENKIEIEEIERAARARYQKQECLIEDFAIECELGVDKANFFEALASLCEKMGEEG